jgi:hypothetical protein
VGLISKIFALLRTSVPTFVMILVRTTARRSRNGILTKKGVYKLSGTNLELVVMSGRHLMVEASLSICAAVDKRKDHLLHAQGAAGSNPASRKSFHQGIFWRAAQ